MSAPREDFPGDAAQPNPLLTEPEFVPPFDGSAVEIPVPKGRRAAAAFIFLTVTLDMLALGMIAPVLPRLIERFMHGNTAGAAEMLGLFGTVFALMQFLFSPVLGSLSDRFGRRPVVLLSNFGLGLDYLLMGWAPALDGCSWGG
jgi:DHA1 family tetracycline resistance protein-like MFS transporter